MYNLTLVLTKIALLVRTIQDKEIFNANQDLFETDRKAFEDEVRKLAN